MYAKLINNQLEYAPEYINDERGTIIGYNLDSNSEMLLKDGYKLVIEKEQPTDMKQPELSYKETKKTIEYVWTETYVEPTIEEKNKQVEQARASAYQTVVDPMTAEINRLRDEEQTPEVMARIAELIMTRKDAVAKIKEANPYIASVENNVK